MDDLLFGENPDEGIEEVINATSDDAGTTDVPTTAVAANDVEEDKVMHANTSGSVGEPNDDNSNTDSERETDYGTVGGHRVRNDKELDQLKSRYVGKKRSNKRSRKDLEKYLNEHKDEVPMGEELSEADYEHKLTTFKSFVEMRFINSAHEVLMELNVQKEHVRYKLYKDAVNLIICCRHKEGEC